MIQVLPMKIWKLPKHKQHLKYKVCNSEEYFAQVKEDGCWYQFQKDKGSYLFSRVISKKTSYLTEKSANVPHIIDSMNKVPEGTIILGEIYYPGLKSNDVTKIMGCLPEEAIKRQEEELGCIYYYIYDILYFNNESLLNKTNIERYHILQDVYQEYLSNEEYITLADIYEDNIEELLEEVLARGGEGIILKRYNGLYHQDKRPAWETIKFKAEDEADVICIGFEEPTMSYEGTEIETWSYWLSPDKKPVIGQFWSSEGYKPITKAYYNGWKGAIKMGVYKNNNLIEIGTLSSGLTDELLENIKHNQKEYIGKPILVEYMNTTEDGALRHPRFKNFRDDINPIDCTWEKIFE